MTRPVDRWDYDGDCPACYAGELHTLEAHDAALAEAAWQRKIGVRHSAAEAIAFQAGITVEEALRFVGETL